MAMTTATFESKQVEDRIDALLELLPKYPCYLKRGDKSTADYLEEHYENYINDLRKSVSVNDNPLIGADTCKIIESKIDEIAENALEIVRILKKYNCGKIVGASNDAIELFSKMKPHLIQRLSISCKKQQYYRIRESNEPLKREDLFHIPNKSNYLVGTQRYSVPGNPCLYLASSPELAWLECKYPKSFSIAKFQVPQEENNYFKFIDFSENLTKLKKRLYSRLFNIKMKEIYESDEENKIDKKIYHDFLFNILYVYPLRAACSVIAKYPNAKFIEEYVLPQLLLLWVRNDKDFDGIRYLSCTDSCTDSCLKYTAKYCSHYDVKTYGESHNLVLVTKEFDENGYDTKLRKYIRVGHPKRIDITSFDTNDPFYWGMEDISDEFELI